MDDVSTKKSALRKKMGAMREGMEAHFRQSAASGLVAHLPFFDRFRDMSRAREGYVAFYMPLNSEIDPQPLACALAEHFHLCLPVVRSGSKALEFRAFSLGDQLIEGRFGVREPLRDKSRVIPQVLLVPLLAADHQGGRLGYGGGYYDHTLTELRQKQQVSAIGLAFESQLVDAVPQDGFDVRLDALLTEKKIRLF